MGKLSAWDPDQYERFAAERKQPLLDLLALVEPAADARIVDLGCGTGETTHEVHARLHARETVGVERSAAMIERSGTFTAPGLRFAHVDIEAFITEAEPASWDVVLSNAALHWLPDHRGLLARIARLVRPGGQLAVQVPANHDQPSRLVAETVSAEEPFATLLAGWRSPAHVLAPEEYARLLHELGFRDIHVRLQVYPHVLGSRDDVVEWVKGTTLTAWRERLADGDYDRFVQRYAERLRDELPDERPFFFPFKRILLRGRR